MKPRSVLVVALLALTAVVYAEGQSVGSDETLGLASETMGALGIETLRYSGSGSSYTYDPDDASGETRQYSRVETYTQEVSTADLSTRLEIRRLVGEQRTEETEARTVDLDTPWESQIDLWLNPHLFLQQAMARNATVEPETDFGVDYQVVRFETPSGHLLSGYIDQNNLLRKIRAQIGEQTIEASYRDYEDFGGIQFPTIMIRKQEASPILILVVKDVEHADV